MRMALNVLAGLLIVLGLSMGGTMDSFAAGWSEVDGSWSFINEDGSKAYDQWRKSEDNWYWLDSSGVMATAQIVEYNDNYYYVDDEGVMVTNEWVQVENDETGEDAPHYWWYYFQADGKAYKARENGRTSFKTINGKKYAFAEDGKMLFGWVDESSARQTDPDAWKTCMYYLGDEDDGAAAVGWRKLPVIDDDTARWDGTGGESEDQEYWFYFQNNCRKLCARKSGDFRSKVINGARYSFDETGRMAFGWTRLSNSSTTASPSMPGSGTGSPSGADYYYFRNRDDGARVNRGWFKAGPSGDESWDGSDEAHWFYAYNEGKLCVNKFRNIGGKGYCFDNSGRMLTGLQAVYTDSLGRVWNRRLDEENELMMDATSLVYGGGTTLRLINENGSEIVEEITVRDALLNAHEGGDQYGEDGGKRKPAYGVYYFGGEDDGAARESDCKVWVDGEAYSFSFGESSSNKGKGWNGLKGRYLYQEGRRVKADKDNKYEAYFIAAEPWEKDEAGETVRAGSQEYQDVYASYCADQDNYFIPGHVYYLDKDQVYILYVHMREQLREIGNGRIYLIGANGSVKKGSNKLFKDGDGGKFQVVNNSTVLYAWPSSVK